MKKIYALFICIFSIALNSSAQDIVVDNYGNRYNCYITQEDSMSVSFRFNKGEAVVDTVIQRENIFNYRYNVTLDTNEPKFQAKNCLTFGICAGGSSIVGMEYERKLSKHWGVQVGAGVAGASAGINVHFLPSLRSSYVSAQCWLTGFGNNDNWMGRKSIIAGPSITWRSRSWFTGTVGFGYIIKKGPAFSDDAPDNIPFGLKFSIGGYLPL